MERSPLGGLLSYLVVGFFAVPFVRIGGSSTLFFEVFQPHNMKTKHRVFICHWHDNYRKSLRYVLKYFKNAIEFVGECNEYPDCMEWLENNATDTVLIGFPSRVKKTDHIIKELTDNYPNIDFVTMSVFEIDYLTEFYKKVGALDNFATNRSADDLIDIILKRCTK